MKENKIRVNISISSDVLKQIDENAKKTGLTRSGYLSKVGTSKTAIIVIEEIKSFIKELNHIGNNLNQLTMLAHQGKVDVIKLDTLHELMKEIKKTLFSIINK